MPSKDQKAPAEAETGEKKEKEEDKGKTQGTIWTQYQLPFAVFAMPGVINATIAGQTGMSDADVDLLAGRSLERDACTARPAAGVSSSHSSCCTSSTRTRSSESDFSKRASGSTPSRTERVAPAPSAGKVAARRRNCRDVILNVEKLAERLNGNRDQIARARVWIDPQLRVPGRAHRPARHLAGGGLSGPHRRLRAARVDGPLSEARHPRHPRQLPVHPAHDLTRVDRRDPGPGARSRSRPIARGGPCAVFGSLQPVRTVSQQLSLHGKQWIGSGGNDSFHRPTTIEFVVKPHYRVYYTGPLADDLADRRAKRTESVPNLPGQRVLPDVPRVGRCQASRTDSQRCRVDHLHDCCSECGGRAIGCRNRPPVCPRRRFAPRAHRRQAVPRDAQRDLRGLRTSNPLHADGNRGPTHSGSSSRFPGKGRSAYGNALVRLHRPAVGGRKARTCSLSIISRPWLAGCGNANGSIEDRLAFLAGLAHDAAKAARDWQHYIRGGSRKGPPHAPTGAALFAFWADDLIPRWANGRRDQERWHDLALDWARIIDHHHGALDDLSDLPPWEQGCLRAEHEPASLLATCDQDGLDALDPRSTSPRSGRTL